MGKIIGIDLGTTNSCVATKSIIPKRKLIDSIYRKRCIQTISEFQ